MTDSETASVDAGREDREAAPVAARKNYEAQRRAMVQGDTTALARLLADKFTLTHFRIRLPQSLPGMRPVPGQDDGEQ